MHRHLALVGLMGSGKSTVGRILAERLRRPLIDTDHQVESATGIGISELFATRGEAAFRRYELETLTRALARHEPSIIATGGGVVTTADARQALGLEATVVWLRASPEALAARLHGDSSRPLIGDREPVEVLRELHARRAPLYEEVADVIVDVDRDEAAQVAEHVLEMLGLPA